MSQITVIRNGVSSGPYTESQLVYYLENNKILLNDYARIDNAPEMITVAAAMKKCNWPLPRARSPVEGIRKIGADFIFPWEEIRKLSWTKDLRFLYLALIGLLPLLIVCFSGGSITYIAIAVYFSVLWGIFFYFLFKTDQVELKECVRCFCVTAFISTSGLIVLHALGVFGIASAAAESSSFLPRFCGMLFAAGIPEELCKAAVIFWFVRRPGKICAPQTIVLYGLFSGLGFGINEGVCYQLEINRKMAVDDAYFLNVLRLTSLPFLHASWCGISAYFIAFSAIFPAYRKGLWIIAILIPAVIHALYNSMGALGLIPALCGVILFTIYLATAKNLKLKLG